VKTITEFAEDEGKRRAFDQCIDHYGCGDPNADWPNNMLSRHLVVYESGVMMRRGDTVSHFVDPREFELCQQISNRASDILGDMPVGMGSEDWNPFSPFFVVANHEADTPENIDERLIRRIFGGTIFPSAKITVQELSETESWWRQTTDCLPFDGTEKEHAIDSWRELIAFLHSSNELTEPSFVSIGDEQHFWDMNESEYPPGTDMTPCVMPRLVVCLTKNGSIVGLFGHVVYT
jgi:hypothetical protein